MLAWWAIQPQPCTYISIESTSEFFILKDDLMGLRWENDRKPRWESKKQMPTSPPQHLTRQSAENTHDYAVPDSKQCGYREAGRTHTGVRNMDVWPGAGGSGQRRRSGHWTLSLILSSSHSTKDAVAFGQAHPSGETNFSLPHWGGTAWPSSPCLISIGSISRKTRKLQKFLKWTNKSLTESPDC